MAGTRLFQGVAPAAGKRAAPVSAIVAEALARMPSPDGTDATAAYLERLGDTLRRIEFELDFEGEPDARIQQTFRRQTAILIVALARLLPLTPLTRQAIWRTALRTMAAAGLGLELYAPAVDELYFTAAADQESSPVATLALLVSAVLAFDFRPGDILGFLWQCLLLIVAMILTAACAVALLLGARALWRRFVG